VLVVPNYRRLGHCGRTLIDGGRLIVSSPDVPDPVAVRYAWENHPDCILCNGAGRPALPFRTDDWE
jgi:sialate O-acetylesterase